MIRGLVDFSLNNRLLVVALAILLFAWGIVSFKNLPIEAYPDIANNYVQIITQWPGRAAEEVEQQVTIPVEIVMNGLPHLQHLRSTSLFGLSSVMLIFDDESANDWNRQKVLERLAQLTLPQNLQPQIGTDYSPVGQIYWYTLTSTNPGYDLMELKSLQDWVLEKQFKSVPNVVDVVSFGGLTKEYQVAIDPNKLVAYGLSIAQIEQPLTNNNVNAGGSFIEAGLQQINVRAVGLFENVQDIGKTVIKTQNGTPIRIGDVASVMQGPRIRLGHAGASHPPRPHRQGHSQKRRQNSGRRRCGRGHRAAAEGRGSRRHATGYSRKGRRAEPSHSSKGRAGRAVSRPEQSGPLHDAYGAAQSDRRHHPGRHRPVSVSGQRARGPDRGPDHSFRSVVRGHLPGPEPHSGESVVARGPGFRHGVGRPGGHRGKHCPPPGAPIERAQAADRAHSRGHPRGAAAGILCARHHHHRLPADLHLTERRGPAVQAHGLDRSLGAAGRPGFLAGGGAGAGQPVLYPEHPRMAQPGVGVDDRPLPGDGALGHSRTVGDRGCRRVLRGGHSLAGVQRPDWLRVSPASRRRRHLGARHIGAQHRTGGGHAADEPSAYHTGSLPGGHAGGLSGGPSRRWHRYYGVLQYGVFCRFEA